MYVDPFCFEHIFQVHTRTLTTRSQAKKQDVKETPCRFWEFIRVAFGTVLDENVTFVVNS